MMCRRGRRVGWRPLSESCERGPEIYRLRDVVYAARTCDDILPGSCGGTFCFTSWSRWCRASLPLKLRSLESSNWLIALIMSTLPASSTRRSALGQFQERPLTEAGGPAHPLIVTHAVPRRLADLHRVQRSAWRVAARPGSEPSRMDQSMAVVIAARDLRRLLRPVQHVVGPSTGTFHRRGAGTVPRQLSCRGSASWAR